MKRRYWICLLLAAAALLCWGYFKTTGEQRVAGKTFAWEEDGFGGAFTIDIHEDGTFQYYEGALSSYIGVGTWEIDGSVITLKDDTAAYSSRNRKNHFEIQDDGLIWVEAGSDNFLYNQLEDGAAFPVKG